MDSDEADPSRLRIAALAAAGVAACALTVAIVLSGTPSTGAGAVAAGRALIVAVPIAVGLYACYRHPGDRFGPLLVALGFGWFVATFAESDDELLYSIGRVAGWIFEAALIYVMLAFPRGRLPDRIDRALVGAAVGLVVLLYLPTGLFTDSYPTPTMSTSCDGGCPGNAFALVDQDPWIVESVIRPLREVVTVLLFAAVVARLGYRIQRATPLLRRTLTPVLVVGAARLATMAMLLPWRALFPDSQVVDVLLWLVALTLPAIALAFLIGLLRWRLFAAEAVHTLAIQLRDESGSEDLREALAEAFHDPSLRVVYHAPGSARGWVDATGHPTLLSSDADERGVAEVRSNGRLVAAIEYDTALSEQHELIETAAGFATMRLENHALTVKVKSSLRELRESRARVLAAADEERRRIERDLHDGAQQRLVALRIKLELAEELVKQDPERGIERLHALEDEVTDALEEIRSLARGVYPSLLSDRGLGEALRAAALQTPIATAVRPNGIGRYRPEVEHAVYFSVLEALQNAAKHAEGAKAITISLTADERLHFEVHDDGAGFDVADGHSGLGMANIRDRIAALGGELEVSSAPDRGTTVSGSVPLD